MTGTGPALPPGTPEDVARNVETHPLQDGRCTACGAKAGGATVLWPCGTVPPRVEMREVGTYFDALGGIHERIAGGGDSR